MDHFYNKNKYVLSTRQYFDAKSDCKLLVKKGINCHISNAFTVSELQLKFKKKISFDGIIITSKNAVKFLNELKVNGKPIFCIGFSTAKSIYKHGYKNNVFFGNDNSTKLADIIISNCKKNFKLLWLTQKNSSNQLIQKLQNNNIRIKRVICYEIKPLDKIDEITINLIKTGQVQVILFYSIYSAKIWLKLIKDAKVNKLLNKVSFVTISEEVSNFLLKCGLSNIENSKRKNRLSVIAKALKVFNKKII